MKRIVLHSASFNSFWAHYSFYTDKYFNAKFLELGYELVFSNQVIVNEHDIILFFEVKSLKNLRYFIKHLNFIEKIKSILRYFIQKVNGTNYKNENLYDTCVKNNTLNRTFLIVLEGLIDAPENHAKEVMNLCKAVFTWNDNLVDNKKVIKINWPQPVEWPAIKVISFTNKKLLVNISANKYSKKTIELYSARRKDIFYFENRLGSEFDLYGFGWNKPATFLQQYFKVQFRKFKSYKGTVKSKAETFSKYKFALVYENARVPGWITEKIFDCLRSNCIPIYLGAPNISKYVPEDLYIDRTKFSNNENLVDYLLKFDEKMYNAYITRIDNYLRSPEFKNHLSQSLVQTVVSTIEKSIKV